MPSSVSSRMPSSIVPSAVLKLSVVPAVPVRRWPDTSGDACNAARGVTAAGSANANENALGSGDPPRLGVWSGVALKDVCRGEAKDMVPGESGS